LPIRIRSTGEHLVWGENRPIQFGDKVSVEVVENARSDPPSRRKKPDPVDDLRRKKLYVRKMAKELGWKITKQK
jgi:hypothetical protein